MSFLETRKSLNSPIVVSISIDLLSPYLPNKHTNILGIFLSTIKWASPTHLAFSRDDQNMLCAHNGVIFIKVMVVESLFFLSLA